MNCSLEVDAGCNECEQAYYGRHCQYRLECRLTQMGQEYRGLRNMTSQNKVCQFWQSTTPHFHTKTNNEENYCRNPDSVSAPWCYTTDPNKRWEFCSIPLCSDQCTGPQLPPGTDILNPAEPGIGFEYGYEAFILCSDGSVSKANCTSGNWTQFICPGDLCIAPDLPLDAEILNPSRFKIAYENGYLANVLCPNGALLQINCSDGIWDANLTCSDFNCSVPTINGIEQAPVPYKQMTDLNCTEGYKAINKKCQKNATFDEPPFCKDVRCNIAHFNSSAYIIKNKKDIYTQGDVLEIRCNESYVPVSDITKDIMECVENNKWNSTALLCENVICSISNYETRAYKISPTKEFYKYDDQIKVECSDGYISPFNSKYTILKCMKTYSWNTTALTCIQVELSIILAVALPLLVITIPLVASCISNKRKIPTMQEERQAEICGNEKLYAELVELDAKRHSQNSELTRISQSSSLQETAK